MSREATAGNRNKAEAKGSVKNETIEQSIREHPITAQSID
jgi:hypothetical protein